MAAVYYEDRYSYRGTAAEKSALTGMRDKDAFIEIDTGNVYFYDAANESWVKFGTQSGGGSDDTEPADAEPAEE